MQERQIGAALPFGMRSGVPDELMWNYVKRSGTAKSPLTPDESLEDRTEADLQAVRDNAALVRFFFKSPFVAYILD
jgi:hypothetical protein